jgi:hypothetical protein
MKDKEAKFEVINCQSFKGYVLHIGQLEEGQLSVGDEVIVTYDPVSILFWQGARAKFITGPPTTNKE